MAGGGAARAGERVLIRADASLAIGSGHVMRCLSLALALRDRGAEVHFASRVLPGHLHAAIRKQDFALHALAPPSAAPTPRPDLAHAGWLAVDEAQDIADTQAVLGALGGVDALVVDHYALDAVWERALRPQAARIVVIDDLADRAHDADVLVDQNLALDGDARYRSRVPAHCVQLLGPRYALLRPEFAEARARLRTRDGRLRRVLVFLGGVDAPGHTERAIEALAQLGGLEVDVVVGAGNPRAEAIAARCRALGFACACGVADMAARMAAADLAIGAGGSTSWERACLGLPALIVIAADNQRAPAQALERAGCARALEAEAATVQRLASEVAALIDDAAALRAMADRSLALVDGLGAARVARRVLPLRVSLRRATEADRDAVFGWRNHEDVRRHAHDPAPIAREVHDRWYSTTLTHPLRDLLIAEHDGAPVGVLRYDCSGDEALVSIYLVPGRAGQGYGPAVLLAGHRWLAAQRPAIRRVRAEVRPENRPSHVAFREAGYRDQGGVYFYALDANRAEA